MTKRKIIVFAVICSVIIIVGGIGVGLTLSSQQQSDSAQTALEHITLEEAKIMSTEELMQVVFEYSHLTDIYISFASSTFDPEHHTMYAGIEKLASKCPAFNEFLMREDSAQVLEEYIAAYSAEDSDGDGQEQFLYHAAKRLHEYVIFKKDIL